MEWSKDAPLVADAMRGWLIASTSMISPNMSDSRIILGRRSSLILSSLRQEGHVGMPFLCGIPSFIHMFCMKGRHTHTSILLLYICYFTIYLALLKDSFSGVYSRSYSLLDMH